MHLAPRSLAYSVICFEVGLLKHRPAIQFEGISCCLHSGCRRPLLQTPNSRLWIVLCGPRDCVLGLVWDYINFLCSSQYGVVFLFVTKTTLVTHQCVCYCWAMLVGHQCFLFSSLFPLLMSRLRVGQKLEWDTARKASLNWPKIYSIPYNIMLTSKNCGACFLEEAASAQKLDGHQEVMTDFFCIICFVFYFCLYLSY